MDANKEQVQHIIFYAHYHHLDIRIAEVQWVAKFARAFRAQYEHRSRVK